MLLRTRSILMLALVTLARCQNYDPEYRSAEEEAEDHSGYTGEGHEHPDYSKYYSVDTSAPQIAAQIQGKSDSGFVSPIEFSTFFGTPHFAFGASDNEDILKAPIISAESKKENNANGFVTDKDYKGGFSEYDTDGFGVQDYFEQAQKQKTTEDEADEESAEPKPGPNYISHRLPAKKGSYEADVENLKNGPSALDKETETVDVNNGESEEKEDSGFKPSQPLDLAQFQPSADPTKILASTAGYLPSSPEYYKQYTAGAQVPITPYQKYSFQPAASTFGLKTAYQPQATTAPFNPSYAKVASTAPTLYEYQPSEIVSQNLRGKDCIRINKEVSDKGGKFNKQPMHCFICKDPKSGSKYEQCSYTNEPTPKSYYQSTSKSYGAPETYRNKRDESESYADPYEEIKAKSHDYYSKPDEFEKDYYKVPDFGSIQEYNYNPKTLNSEEGEEKSYSEMQSEELLKKGENCHKSHKNGVTCTVCKDSKTGANFEQCSYESAPNQKKYAYVRESKYDGDGNPIEEKVQDSTDPKPVISERRSDDNVEQSPKKTENNAEEYAATQREEIEEKPRNSKLINDDPYDVPSHFAESTEKQRKAGIRGLDPKLYGGSDSSEEQTTNGDEEESKKYVHLDDYHLKLFPQFSKEESKNAEIKTKPDGYFEDLTGKKDVEKVLEEFTRKDRSNCKQIKKKGMTCYLCVDKKGIQQEECMYVSESRPQSSHVAYHGVQHLKAPGNSTAAQLSQTPVEASASEIQKRKKPFKKIPIIASAATPAIDSEANASTNVETRVKFTPETAASTKVYKKKSVKSKRNPKSSGENRRKSEESANDPEPQFDVNDEDGFYAAETKPVFSKTLGLSLPKYMLDKSEFEREFDRTVAAYN